MRAKVGTLSVCMIVKDEAANIQEALSSVQGVADEIVVVDTGSTDGTPDLARSFTPQVFHYAWHDDFAAARNFSLDKATCSYCLWWDADDRVDAENAHKIRELKKHFDGLRAFAFELRDIRQGQINYSLFQVRCFPNRKSIRFQGRIHEAIDWDALADHVHLVNTNIVLTHHGYNDPAVVARKELRNIRLLQRERESSRNDPTLHYYLAISFSRLGRGDLAITHMSKVVEQLDRVRFRGDQNQWARLKPYWLDTHLVLAGEWIQLGNLEEARRCLTRVQCLDGLDAVTLYRIGALWQRLGNHAWALRFLLKVDPDLQVPLPIPVPRLRPQDVAARIACSLFALDRVGDARSCLQALPDPVARREAWEQVGMCAAEAGMTSLSEMAFKEALRYGFLAAEAWDQWGELCRLRGDRRKAEAHWKKALEIAPGLESARIRLANLYWQCGRNGEAYEAFKDLVQKGCLKVAVLLAFAQLAMERNDRAAGKAAEEALALAIDCGAVGAPSEPSLPPFLALADLLEHQGKKELARLAARLNQWSGELVHLSEKT